MKSPSAVTRNYLLAIVLVCILCVPSDAYSEPKRNETAVMEKRYRIWLRQHSKHYGSDEYGRRFKIFNSNVKLIDFVNSQNLSYKLAINKFADMTNYEFQTTYLGYKSDERTYNQLNHTIEKYALPSSVDWRKKQVVTEVKSQGQCGTKCFCHFYL